MIDLRAAWLLTGHYLPPITTAEALVLPLLHHFWLGFLLHGDFSLPFLQFHFLSWRLVLNKSKKKEGYKSDIQ